MHRPKNTLGSAYAPPTALLIIDSLTHGLCNIGAQKRKHNSNNVQSSWALKNSIK